MPEGRTVFELRAGDLQEADLIVQRISGKERLSEPYRFDVDFSTASGDPLELPNLCGKDALITLRRPSGAERHVHGVLSAVQMTGLQVNQPLYRATVVPQLERLRHISRSRIFQSMTLPDIAKQVLDEGGVTQRFSLDADYPTREFVTQYRETDLAFVSRLLEEAGVFFYFEHEADGHTLVAIDAVSAGAGGDLQLPFRLAAPPGDEEGDEHLFRLQKRRRVTSSKVTVRDFDFTQPGLQNSADSGDAGDEKLEWYEYPGGFVDPDAGSGVSKVRLEERRYGAATCQGEGTCLTLLPGATFEAIEHPEDSFNGKLFLVGVTHEAEQQQPTGAGSTLQHDYRNAFEALAADAPYRPKRQTPRPRAYPTTATVVGPSNEEIYPDSYGRVKVQFHWDREGQKDDKSSCWIRCAQPMAGPGFGGVILPRVGQEVLVKFLGGDPDRPLITGATYNGGHAPPLSLPEQKTASTLRSESSPGGGGFNELRFEDRTGAEQIQLHAQLDHKIEVLADKEQSVAGSESLEVAKDRTQQVSGEQDLAVRSTDTSQVGGNQSLTVTGNRGTVIAASDSLTVGGSLSVHVAGGRTLSVRQATDQVVGGAALMTVGAAYGVAVMGAMNAAIGAAVTRAVRGDHVENVGATRGETVGGNAVCRVGHDLTADVAGSLARVTGADHAEVYKSKCEIEVTDVASFKAKELHFKAEKLTILVGGNVALQIEDGEVTFGSKTFDMKGESEVQFKGSKIQADAADSAASDSATVSSSGPQKGDHASVAVSLKDDDGNPVANEWVRAEFPDGTTREVQTDGSGNATVFGPKEGNVKISLIKRDEGSWNQA